MSVRLTIVHILRGETALPASAALFAARLAGAITALMVQVMLARMMPPAALGLFFFATSLAAVLAVVAAAGYPQAATRFLSRYRAAGRANLCDAFVRTTRRDIAVWAIILAATIAGLAVAFADRQTAAAAVAVAATAVPPLALSLLFGSVANVQRRFLLASLPDFLLRPLGMLFVVAALAWSGIVWDVPMLMAAFVLLCLGVTIIQAIGLRRKIPYNAPAPITRRRTRLWRSSAFPLVTVALFTALFADVAIVAASPFLPRGDLAALAICLKISLLVGFVIQVAHQTLMPGVAEDLHGNRAEPAMARVRDANRVIAGIMLAATMFAWLLGDRLLALFDPAFASAHHVLVILVASQAVRALAGPAAQMLTITGQQRYVVIACPLALVLLAVSNAVLIPHHGLTGAAAAVLITIAVWSGALSYLWGHSRPVSPLANRVQPLAPLPVAAR